MSSNNNNEVDNQNLKLSFTSEVQSISADESTKKMMMFTLTAPVYETTGRAPIDVIAIVDRSGSMEGDKMTLTIETLKFIVEQLANTDNFGIICYDDSVRTYLELSNMSKEGKDKAFQVIETIHTGGSTNLCGGLLEGIKQMRERPTGKKNKVASLLLLTDGQANVGYQTAEDITRAMVDQEFANKSGSGAGVFQQAPQRQQRQRNAWNQSPVQQPVQQQYIQQQNVQQNFSPLVFQNINAPQQQQMQSNFIAPQQPIPTLAQTEEVAEQPKPVTESKTTDLQCVVYTFGFGSDHNPKLLKDISDAGNGVYYFIQNNEDIPKSFADCLGGLLSVCAQNISIKIEATNNATLDKVFTRYSNKVLEAGKSFEIKIGDVQSEEQKDILLRLSLPALQAPTDRFECLKFTVSYFNVVTSDLLTEELVGVVARPAQAPLDQPVNYNLDKQRNRVSAAEAMENATQLANSGKLEEARSVVSKIIADIKKSISGSDPFCLGLITDLEECNGGLKDRNTWASEGTYNMQNQISSHQQQRSSNISKVSQASYQNKSKSAMQSAWSSKNK